MTEMYKPSQGWGTKKRNATSPRSYGERVLASTGSPGGVSGTPPQRKGFTVLTTVSEQAWDKGRRTRAWRRGTLLSYEVVGSVDTHFGESH